MSSTKWLKYRRIYLELMEEWVPETAYYRVAGINRNIKNIPSILPNLGFSISTLTGKKKVAFKKEFYNNLFRVE